MFSVLVNSSDGYQDCWEPFFRLFARHWPDCPAPVFLHTQTLDRTSPHRPVACLPTGPRLPWSDALAAALSRIPDPVVLYLQEDYFFEAPVNGDLIGELAGEMIRNPEIAHIGLTHFGAMGPFESTSDERLWRIARDSRYRVSTQAGLWRTDHLRSCLVPGEGGWMFEIFGTWRARRRNDLYLTVNRDRFGPGSRVIDYLHTGIVKGKWHPALPAVFERFGIEADFSRRGFYRDPGPIRRRLETARAAAQSPRALLSALASLL